MELMNKQNNNKVNNFISTFQFRIKDSNLKLVKSLFSLSGTVNFVWNYCNDIQQQAVKRNKPWLSSFDLSNLTSGSSKLIGLHSQTVQAVCEEYANKRSQFKKPFLKFRTNKYHRNLPWIPFKSSAIKFDSKTGSFTFMGLKLKTWYSRKFPKNAVIKNGSICCDSTGKWFVNLTFELKFESTQDREDYKLSQTSKGQNLIAIDPGLNPMLTFCIENPEGELSYEELEPQRLFVKSQAKLGMAQRAKKKKLTKTIHKKLKNQRKDFHNKLSLKLVRENHSIVNSNISYKMLMKSKLKGHAKAWQDIGQGYFRSILNNKAAKHNVQYVEVCERMLLSTQTCSECKSLTGPKGRKGLCVSEWECIVCGTNHNRNENSAKNHLQHYKQVEANRLNLAEAALLKTKPVTLQGIGVSLEESSSFTAGRMSKNKD